jgi:hypothetical protein
MRDNEFTRQADEFLEKANAKLTIRWIGLMRNEMWDGKELRDRYEITLTTPKGSMTIDFWDSIHDTEIHNITAAKYAEIKYKQHWELLWNNERQKIYKELSQAKQDAEVTAYDILSCLEKYEIGTFEEFCAECGYSNDSIRAYKTFIACDEQYKKLKRLFTEEQMEELCEIN